MKKGTQCYYQLKESFCKVGSRWDKMALTKETAVKYAEEHLNKEPKKFRSESHANYTPEYCLAHWGQSINWRYRKDQINEMDREIAELLDTRRTNVDLVVYRGVHDTVFDLMLKNAKGFKDADLLEKGFLPTSLVKGQELTYKIKLRIFVPSGTKCVYMGNVNEEFNLYEVAIQHGAVLKIISMDKDYINCRLIRTA